VAARVALAVVAMLVLATLGVMERSERLGQEGFDAVARGELRQGDALLRRATVLNPNTEVDGFRAQALGLTGQPVAAMRVLEGVVRREPDNLGAWADLLRVSRGRDPAQYRRAAAALGRLDPVSVRRYRLLRRR
jgi:hypothetical protein